MSLFTGSYTAQERKVIWKVFLAGLKCQETGNETLHAPLEHPNTTPPPHHPYLTLPRHQSQRSHPQLSETDWFLI